MITISSFGIVGLNLYPVQCEVHLSLQLPCIQIVGLPGTITQESRERIKAATQNAGLEWPSRKVTINLLPVDLPKWGSHFELAMALGVLICHSKTKLSFDFFAIGELSLSGEIRPCGWIGLAEPYLQRLQRAHPHQHVVLMVHPQDAATINSRDCLVVSVSTLKEAMDWIQFNSIQYLKQENKIEHDALSLMPVKVPVDGAHYKPQFSLLNSVQGEPLGKLAALLCIFNGFHALFAGPQGMGKSLLIQAIVQALPPLSQEKLKWKNLLRQSLKNHYSKGGYDQSGEEAINGAPPRVYLQSSTTRAALEGAMLPSGQVLAGSMTEAHFGVLIADEFLELSRDVLESLRQPLEEGEVRLQRARYRITLPTQFQLLASTNLCPCGAAGDSRKFCRCLRSRLNSYQSKLSGPILDRFDLIVLIGHKGKNWNELDFEEREIISFLLDSKNWINFFNLREKTMVGEVESEKAFALKKEFFQSLEDDSFSERVQKKVMKVACALSTLQQSPLTMVHFRLAAKLRAELFKGS